MKRGDQEELAKRLLDYSRYIIRTKHKMHLVFTVSLLVSVGRAKVLYECRVDAPIIGINTTPRVIVPHFVTCSQNVGETTPVRGFI